MKFTDVTFAKDTISEMTKERKKAVNKYLELNEIFADLRKNGIVTFIKINKVQIETDIEQAKIGMSEEEMKELPKKEFEYLQFTLFPYAILEGANGAERCLDNYDTETINLINERIESKVEAYKEFLKSE